MAVLIVFMLTMVACASAPAGDGGRSPRGPTQASAVADQRIEMRVGTSARIEGTGVTLVFVGVTDDSRCPAGAACVWEGDAVVELRVESGGTAEVLHLHTNGFAREGRAGGVAVRLEDLVPRPTANGPVPPGDYVATLMASAR